MSTTSSDIVYPPLGVVTRPVFYGSGTCYRVRTDQGPRIRCAYLPTAQTTPPPASDLAAVMQYLWFDDLPGDRQRDCSEIGFGCPIRTMRPPQPDPWLLPVKLPPPRWW